MPIILDAYVFSLACMRRDKLEGLEAAGFTPSGQRCTPTIPNEDSPLLLDNEFPPVFLDNEKIDREVGLDILPHFRRNFWLNIFQVYQFLILFRKP